MDAQPIRGNAVRLRGIGEAATECLRNSPYLNVRSISCEWAHGVLFLRGRLSSFHQKQVAQDAVSRIEGVERVRNEIDVD